jgi:hypothetical protein
MYGFTLALFGATCLVLGFVVGFAARARISYLRHQQQQQQYRQR